MNIVEEVAKALHNGWWKALVEAGYQVGPSGEKTHPHLMAFELCGIENNNCDRIQAALLLDILIPEIKRNKEGLEVNDVAGWCHQSWARMVEINGRETHPHIKDSWEKDHKEARRNEHIEQAVEVLNIIDRNKEFFMNTKSWKET